MRIALVSRISVFTERTLHQPLTLCLSSWLMTPTYTRHPAFHINMITPHIQRSNRLGLTLMWGVIIDISKLLISYQKPLLDLIALNLRTRQGGAICLSEIRGVQESSNFDSSPNFRLPVVILKTYHNHIVAFTVLVRCLDYLHQPCFSHIQIEFDSGTMLSGGITWQKRGSNESCQLYSVLMWLDTLV